MVVSLKEIFFHYIILRYEIRFNVNVTLSRRMCYVQTSHLLTSHPSLVAVFSVIKPDLCNITIRISAFYLAILPFQLLWRDSHRRNVRIRNVVPPAPLHHRYINLRHVCVGKQRTEIRGMKIEISFQNAKFLRHILITFKAVSISEAFKSIELTCTK